MRLFINLFFFISLTQAACGPSDSFKASQLNEEGLRLINEGREHEAIVAYYQASSFRSISDSDRTNYLGNLALAYHKIQFNDSAKHYFKQAASLNPKDSYYFLVNLAYVFLINNKLDSTRIFLEKAYHIDSNKPAVNNLLGLIYLGEYDKAFYDPVKALQYNIIAHKILQDGDTKFVLAKNYYQVNKTHEALKLFRSLHKDFPDYVSYLVTLIMMEQEMNNISNSEALLQELKVKDIDKYNQRLSDPIQPGTHVIVWNP